MLGARQGSTFTPLRTILPVLALFLTGCEQRQEQPISSAQIEEVVRERAATMDGDHERARQEVEASLDRAKQAIVEASQSAGLLLEEAPAPSRADD
jgi:uncharacterized lipoprotein YajG